LSYESLDPGLRRDDLLRLSPFKSPESLKLMNRERSRSGVLKTITL
jgi:hypothetical protein